jgi:dTDP-4-amino-4,6-dideoxygalactose transaminase
MSQAPQGFDRPVYVTRPLLPPLQEYMHELEAVWASGWLANGGQQHVQLEQELAKVLGAQHLSLFNNGTIALIVACQALRLSGEVLTSPFTFPATPHVLTWNNVTPVFVDIDPETMCLDPSRMESQVTGRTTGILGVHVYGIPCDVHAIDTVARTYGLKVVYDGAHAFGTLVDGKPVSSFGDATMYSFHATKLFHTAEGGALAVSDGDLKKRIDLLKNFGIKNEHEVVMPGINGKMSELQAALGRVVLRHVEAERNRRAAIRRLYAERLREVEGLRLVELPANVADSFQYLVMRVDAARAGCSRDQLHERLKRFNIITRKYFYPLCSDYSCYRHLPSARPENLPNAYRLAQEVMTLPLFGGLSDDDVHRICDAIVWCVRNG